MQHPLRATYAFTLALLPLHSLRQRDGGNRPSQALNRLLVEPSEVQWNSSPPRVTLPPSDARSVHVRNILGSPPAVRAGVTDAFLVDDAPLEVLGDGSVVVELCERLRRAPPPPPDVTLLLAMPRPKVLQRLLPQIAAIGVRRIVVCGAYKVEKAYWASDVVKREELVRGALIEGVMQAGVDCIVPEVTFERFLKPFLEDRLGEVAGEGVLRIVAEPDEEGTRVEEVLRGARAAGGGREVLLAVGPEGGWMPRELSMLEGGHGFQRVCLGARILKTDAAVIILLGILHDAMARAVKANAEEAASQVTAQ